MHESTETTVGIIAIYILMKVPYNELFLSPTRNIMQDLVKNLARFLKVSYMIPARILKS